MDNKSFGILQVNDIDIEGGAAKIAFNLFKTLDEFGYNSYYAVGVKRSDQDKVIQISNDHIQGKRELYFSKISEKMQKIPVIRIFSYYINLFSKPSKIPVRLKCFFNGTDFFEYPETANILKLIPSFKPDIIHCHNLQWGYFDLRMLPEINKHVPVVITHHDAWLISGFCNHSFDCNRWKTGCGQCPYRPNNNFFLRDGTEKNWKQKNDIFKKCHFYVVTPCEWLMDMVNQSMMTDGIQGSKVIANGVDLNFFFPSDQRKARFGLNLQINEKILLFVGANLKKSQWKDYKTLLSSIKEIASVGMKILCLIIGDKSPSIFINDVEIRFIPYISDPKIIAGYYNAADIYFHPARADTFPTVILEALACGTPVVASAVGGIPEQIIEGETGFLIPQGDSKLMAKQILLLLKNNKLRHQMGENAANDAAKRFGLERMVSEYIEVYNELLINNNSSFY